MTERTGRELDLILGKEMVEIYNLMNHATENGIKPDVEHASDILHISLKSLRRKDDSLSSVKNEDYKEKGLFLPGRTTEIERFISYCMIMSIELPQVLFLDPRNTNTRIMVSSIFPYHEKMAHMDRNHGVVIFRMIGALANLMSKRENDVSVKFPLLVRMIPMFVNMKPYEEALEILSTPENVETLLRIDVQNIYDMMMDIRSP
jgi:hypothetical protein